MKTERSTFAAVCLTLMVVAPLLMLSGCQTPAQPRAWYDEFSGEHGQFVYASRQSGGYDVRFVINDNDPEHVIMHVRSTRSPIRGDRAYFLLDGERVTQPMSLNVHTRTTRAHSSHVGVGVGRGVGTGVSTGVGMSFPRYTHESVHDARVRMPIDFVQRMIAADEARFRVGESAGPSYTLSERTRERLAELTGPYASGQPVDE
ncbi:hypothetical protein ACERK3_01055 [Phycisphaerales bacterium AB-hyl4]|uniref:Lipoprotein n=1 Tax=Natronomicrosphaera hydrolytica TaxID=3242702 RepID=A0ABV4TZV1_9BACT